MKKKIIILLCISFSSMFSREEKVDHLLQGNLALPTSQEPGPLFCLGQNIVDKGDIQGFLLTNIFAQKNNHVTQFVPNTIYGITDNLSLFAGIPVGKGRATSPLLPTGLEDLFIQAEYAFYNFDTPTYANQATVVANVVLPTKHAKEHPFAGLNSTSFFLGGTANHMSIDWYVFASGGVQISKRDHFKNFGKRFFYQWGIGKNLYYQPSKKIVTLLLEFFGTYSQCDRLHGKKMYDSKSNIFYIGPCLWFSTSRLIMQTGVAAPISQKILPILKTKCLWAFEVGWKFNP